MTTSNYVNKKGMTFFTGIGLQEFGGSDIIRSNVGKASFEVSSGLINEHAFYARLSKVVSDGYRDRSGVEMYSYFLSATRFDANLSTQINIFGGPISDELAYTGLPKSYMKDEKLRLQNWSYFMYDSTGKAVGYNTVRKPIEKEGFYQPHYEILNDWQALDGLTVKSALFYYSGEGYYDSDVSYRDSTDLRLGAEYGWKLNANPANAVMRSTVKNSHGGWIPRAIWKNCAGESVFGLEIRSHRSEHYGQVLIAESLPENFDPEYKMYSYEGGKDIYGGFVRHRIEKGDLAVSAEAQLTSISYSIANEKAGGRYTYYNTGNGTKAGGEGELFSVNYLFFNPRIGVTLRLSDETGLFAQIAHTSREPRLKQLYAAEDVIFSPDTKPLFEKKNGVDGTYDFSKPLIKPEKMLNFEIGGHYKDEMYLLGFNLFYMDYSDELVKSGAVDPFGNPIEGNAPKTVHAGAEFQGSAILYSHDGNKLSLSANMTYSHNRIVDYDYQLASGGKVSLSNNTVAGFPDLMGNVRVTFRNETFSASILGKFVGESRSDNFGDMLTTNDALKADLLLDPWDIKYYDDNKVEAYFVMNADFSVNIGRFAGLEKIRLIAQCNNIFNKLYAAGAEGREFFPAAERNYFFGLELGF